MSTIEQAQRRWRELSHHKRVPAGIGLFEEGNPDDTKAPSSFVMRVNRQVFVQAVLRPNSKRCDLATAISSAGRLGLHAELVVFGTWMVADGMPGATKRRGKRADPGRLLKVAACCFAALENADLSAAAKPAPVPRINTKHVVEIWKKCFDGVGSTSDYGSSLRSLRLILPDYLACVAAGTVAFNGQRVTASPLLERLAEAISTEASFSGASPTLPSPAPAVAASPISASPGGVSGAPAVASAGPAVIASTFEIPLVYSSPAKEAEYRGSVPSPHAAPTLRYRIEPHAATKTGSKARPTLAGRLVFKPDHPIAGSVILNALIDRIALTVSTVRSTSNQVLQSAITSAGANVHVEDRTKLGARKDHHASLPELHLREPTGRHFAVTFQDPTPPTLRAALDTIERIAGIDGEVRLFVLELAVDLYPERSLSPADALLAREQLVGLVQRHVWSAGSAFDVPIDLAPREIDQRQVYRAESKKVRFFFADAKARWHSDRDLDEEAVRRSLLTVRPGNELYLDATIYRGHKMGRKRVNAQHKIEDKRNYANGTSLILPDQARRARIEVTLTSLQALEEVGLRTIDDLKRCNFRDLRRDVLLFRLPTCDPVAEDVNRTMAQMRTRGVYGVELSQRARYHEDREHRKPKPRSSDHEGRGLVDWPEMNDKVGEALDQLGRRWRKF